MSNRSSDIRRINLYVPQDLASCLDSYSSSLSVTRNSAMIFILASFFNFPSVLSDGKFVLPADSVDSDSF